MLVSCMVHSHIQELFLYFIQIHGCDFHGLENASQIHIATQSRLKWLWIITPHSSRKVHLTAYVIVVWPSGLSEREMQGNTSISCGKHLTERPLWGENISSDSSCFIQWETWNVNTQLRLKIFDYVGSKLCEDGTYPHRFAFKSLMYSVWACRNAYTP